MDPAVLRSVRTADDRERVRDLMRYIWRYGLVATVDAHEWNQLALVLRERLAEGDPLDESWVDLLDACGAPETHCTGGCLLVRRGSMCTPDSRNVRGQVGCKDAQPCDASVAVPNELLRWDRLAAQVSERPSFEHPWEKFWRNCAGLASTCRGLVVVDRYVDLAGVQWLLGQVLPSWTQPAAVAVVAGKKVKVEDTQAEDWRWLRDLSRVTRLVWAPVRREMWEAVGHDRFVLFGTRAVVDLSAGVRELRTGFKPMAQHLYSAAADSTAFHVRWAEAGRLFHAAQPWEWRHGYDRPHAAPNATWPLRELLGSS